jgi:hypothetical protein
MKNAITGTLIEYSRIDGSVNGNPNFLLTIEVDGERIYTRSSSDSAFCYEVTNHKTPCAVTFTTTRSGRVNYMKWSK